MTTISFFVFDLNCVTVGESGKKFYIVQDGEVTIELPDPKIPAEEFGDRYN